MLELDSALVEGAVPLGVEIVVEDEVLVAGDREPILARDLSFQLAGRPAGVAEREQTAARPFASGDRAQDLHIGAERDLTKAKAEES